MPCRNGNDNHTIKFSDAISWRFSCHRRCSCYGCAFIFWDWASSNLVDAVVGACSGYSRLRRDFLPARPFCSVQARSNHRGGDDRVRSFCVCDWKCECRSRGNVLCTNRRLVCVALCHNLRHAACMPAVYALVGQINQSNAQLNCRKLRCRRAGRMKFSGSSKRSLFQNHHGS